MLRRRFIDSQKHLSLGCVIVFCVVAIGCQSSVIRSQTPDQDSTVDQEDQKARFVRDMARVWGLQSVEIEGIAMVAQLDGTGSDPPPSVPRDMLLDDMRRRGIDTPATILGDRSTAMVLLRATIPPGIRKGDRFDVEVRVPPNSQTTSLRNGWLMQSRLQEMARLGSELRSGSVLALAEGAVVIDSMVTGETSLVAETRGRVLGGGVANKERALGLVLKSEHHSYAASRLIGQAINNRFHTYDRGIKRGAADPKRDNFIALAIQSQYRHNLHRYARVIEALAIRESESAMFDRMQKLQDELLDPARAVHAALQLEAIGHDAAPVLLKGVESTDPLVRFYSAEALAYLNHESAIEILKKAVAEESALRWRALAGLGAMTNLAAQEALRELLDSESAEAQYGAFQALRRANRRDPLISGENFGDTLAFHEIPTTGRPMVHIRKSERPEIVVFGEKVSLKTPFVLSAGRRILVKGEGNRVKVVRFSSSEDDAFIYTSPRIREIVEAIVELGGSYTDVVNSLTQAEEEGCFDGRLKFDALPQPGRRFRRSDSETPQDDERSDELAQAKVSA